MCFFLRPAHAFASVSCHTRSISHKTNQSLHNDKRSPLYFPFPLSPPSPHLRYIRLEGSRTEGVFRISSSQRVVDRIKSEYDAKGTVDLAEVNDVHASASALKALLRALPEPLLAETVLFRLQRLIKKHPVASGDGPQLASLCIGVVDMLRKAMSPVMFHTLTMLCELCSQLCGSRQVTKWAADGLATTIGPNMYRDAHLTDHGELQAFMVAGNKAVTFLFENYRTLYGFTSILEAEYIHDI